MKGQRSLDHLVLTRLRVAERQLKEIRYLAGQTQAWDKLERGDLLDEIERQERAMQKLGEEIRDRMARESAAKKRTRMWPQEEIEFT